MKIYHYNVEGIFTSEGVANPSPLEPGKYLVPAKATTVEPIAVVDGQVARWTGEEWEAYVAPEPEEWKPASLEEAKLNKTWDIKSTAGALLSPSDWMIVRQAETGQAAPPEVLEYRASVRAVASATEEKVLAATSVDEVMAIEASWPTRSYE